MQGGQSVLPKVFAFSWEANLYASFLIGVLPFAVELARARRPILGYLSLALILIGIPLGITRAAYVGVVAALGVYGGILLYRKVGLRRLAPAAAVGVAVGSG